MVTNNWTPQELAKRLAENKDLAQENPAGVYDVMRLMGDTYQGQTAVSNANPGERSFQQQVIQLAKLKGWKACHFRPARVIIKGVETWRTPLEGDKGCPDTILAKGGKILLWELKTEKGKVTAEEQEWLDASGGKVMRPSDWETICNILQS